MQFEIQACRQKADRIHQVGLGLSKSESPLKPTHELTRLTRLSERQRSAYADL
jgi:hypothetical protein